MVQNLLREPRNVVPSASHEDTKNTKTRKHLYELRVFRAFVLFVKADSQPFQRSLEPGTPNPEPGTRNQSNIDPTDGVFGQTTGTATGAREIQFRVTFNY